MVSSIRYRTEPGLVRSGADERRTDDRRAGLRGPRGRSWAHRALGAIWAQELPAAGHAVRPAPGDGTHGPFHLAHRHRHAAGLQRPAHDAGMGRNRRSEDPAAALAGGVLACRHGDNFLGCPASGAQPAVPADTVAVRRHRGDVLGRIHMSADRPPRHHEGASASRRRPRSKRLRGAGAAEPALPARPGRGVLRVRLPNTAHTSLSWRIHDLTRDFRLEDVWALPTPGEADDFQRLVQAVAAEEASRASPWAAPALWAVRWKIGELLGWDGPDAGLGSRVPTLRGRLPADLRDAPPGP